MTIRRDFYTPGDVPEGEMDEALRGELLQIELKKAYSLAPGTHIFTFDTSGKDKKFYWLQRTPDGVLVQTGEFSIYGDSILVLTGIIGGYRSNDGDPEKSFNGRDYSGGEKMFQFIPVKNDDGDVIEFNLAGIGTMHVLNLAG